MEWPWDPSAIGPEERQCDLCLNRTCDCVQTAVSDAVPKIVPAGDMGEGVEATVPYSVNQFIGELVGELVPLGGHNDGWGAELCRDDLGDGFQAICLVYCRDAGNWGRKVNHSCDPNTEFLSLPISGKWRIIFNAIKPIQAGDAITVSYGESYWKTGRCLCKSELCIDQGTS
ncbi:uncharacterized protein B0J16DRAFT_125195 [Fusarium flagelliforme]|uniref:uncharacterized protein n=1 Tax=Fusarium flagelliforme TaxID=2675880 RepID=UPI001E8D5582|nr:uncharacterized protein B0J16DRAFT_125195 [Fusarium flagelliforme]KAH7185196.1 hypothetical protein B0J16DRAFT_125195 [Fusarium flagelliforme]